jgi:1-acyl-sn-glycerol-3-phosphate acyltransferase
MPESFIRAWFYFTQYLTVPATIGFTILLKLKVERPDNLKLEKGTIIVSNHQSKLDPFLVTYHVGLGQWPHFLPIRYPVHHEFMRGGFVTTVIKALGGFDIGQTPLQKLQGLSRIRSLLKQNYSIVIFPEGKINYTTSEVDEFKRGVEMLFSKNYPVIFVRLENLNKPQKFHFWKKSVGSRMTYSQFYGCDVPVEEKKRAMLNFYGLNY